MEMPLTTDEIRSYSNDKLVTVAREQSSMIFILNKMLRKYETIIGQLSTELGAKNQRVLFIQQSLDRIKGMTFARQSERRTGETEDSSPLFGTGGDDVSDPPDSGAPPPKKRKKREKFGRKNQPDLLNRPVHHTYTAEDCAKYGLVPWEGQYETSELISIEPARVVLENHMRQKYFRIDSLTGERKIITVPGPLKLKEGSRYSLEFAAEIAVAKYQWHLPVDRQRSMLATHGLDITTQVLFEQIDTVAWYLKKNVFEKLLATCKTVQVHTSDDTRWPNLESRKTREKNSYYLWAVRNEFATCFSVYDARSQKVAKDFLAGISGFLVTDGHASFKTLASNTLVLANDWYHVRRKFIAAEKSYPNEAKVIIDKIRALSSIEAELKDQDIAVVRARRDIESRALVVEIHKYLLDLAHILPKSNLGKAINYTLKLWRGLTVFLDHPTVPMHTNDIESAIRGPAVGRKNHYGSNSLATAENAAILYSVVATCKQHQVTPRDYIVGILKAILSREPVLMPWQWREHHQAPADVILDSDSHALNALCRK